MPCQKNPSQITGSSILSRIARLTMGTKRDAHGESSGRRETLFIGSAMAESSEILPATVGRMARRMTKP